MYAQPGQPDVDLPVSPADAPAPSVAHDDGILRYPLSSLKKKKSFLLLMHRVERNLPLQRNLKGCFFFFFKQWDFFSPGRV